MMLARAKRKVIRSIKPFFYKVRRFFERNALEFSKRAFFRSEFNEYTLVELSHLMRRKLYDGEEKIKIAFIFQGASFWPSWETVWEAVSSDERFEPMMFVCDDVIKEKSQFLTARSFLEEKGISYQPIHDVDISEIEPHLVVLQTPYDGGHRPKYLHGNRLTAQGYRVIYIPYGIEIADTRRARSDHFEGAVTRFAWRIYTFSKAIIVDYKTRSKTGGNMVRSFGHPKFDCFVGPNRPEMPQDILDRANGRKIVLWKAHFPKRQNGRLITPSLNEYFAFAQILKNYPDLFFVFMPHPKFYEYADQFIDAEAFAELLDNSENAVQFFDDDYRGPLLNADYHMMDRSALMVEAGVTGKPILFLQNDKYTEPMTDPVQRIVDSYYYAVDCAGMQDFIEKVVLGGVDEMREDRVATLQEILPEVNGKSGIAIKNDIVTGLLRENPAILPERLQEHTRLNQAAMDAPL